MRARALRIEALEGRALLAALWSSAADEPVQAQNSVAECSGPVQELVQTQEQTQQQTQQQDGSGEGPVEDAVQTQTQTQQQDGTCEGPIEAPVQTQEQTQQQDGSGEGPIEDAVQTQTQTQQQDGSSDQDGVCDDSVLLTDAAIESLVGNQEDPPRIRTGIPTQPDTGQCDRDRDGTNWDD